MKIIHYPDGWPLTDYLSKELELVQHVSESVFFTWIVQPTVIYGRHQSAGAEVNEAYCREHGIAVVQRKSGGGCVYADEGNLMVSYITPDTHSEQVFDDFLHILRDTLNAAGLSAVTTAHNDILVDGHKVSGCACYTTPTGTIVHGTLLYDVNMDALTHAITPASDKLARHGVASVRQRVVNIRTLTSAFPDIRSLRAFVESRLAAI